MVAGLIFLVLPASYTFADGSHFEGTWKNFLPHGHGTYTWPDGTVFKGSFNEGQIHGEGELSQQPVGNLLYNERGPIPTKITYTGGFSNGCAGGKGIITFSLDEARTVRENTCTQFSGHFSKGAATGAGEFLYPASVETGQWSEGVYVAGSGNRSEASAAAANVKTQAPAPALPAALPPAQQSMSPGPHQMGFVLDDFEEPGSALASGSTEITSPSMGSIAKRRSERSPVKQ